MPSVESQCTMGANWPLLEAPDNDPTRFSQPPTSQSSPSLSARCAAGRGRFVLRGSCQDKETWLDDRGQPAHLSNENEK